MANKQAGLFGDAGDFAPDSETEFARLRTRVPELERNILAILKMLAVFVRPCKSCGATIYFVLSREGFKIPYTADGVNHFKNCTHLERFSRRGGAA